MGAGVNFQVCGGNTAAFQAVQLRDKILRIQDNAGANQAQCFRIQDTGRNQVELVDFSVIDNSVTGIITAGGTYNNIRTGCHNVNDLSFSFVSPLRTDYNICRHDHSSLFQNIRISRLFPSGLRHIAFLRGSGGFFSRKAGRVRSPDRKQVLSEAVRAAFLPRAQIFTPMVFSEMHCGTATYYSIITGFHGKCNRNLQIFFASCRNGGRICHLSPERYRLSQLDCIKAALVL